MRPELQPYPENPLNFWERVLIQEGLVPISPESKLGRVLGPRLSGKRLILPVLSVITLLAAACSSGADKNSSLNQLPATPKTSESGALPNPENRFAVLGLPFPKDSKMAIQQAWTSSFDPNHHGIDFIKGKPDDSGTWKSFPVFAVADGKACANPPSREGNAIFLTHSIGNTPVGATFYGHLESWEKDIPQCSTGQTVSKRKGDKIGDAGATGAQDQSLTHLHFQVNDANGDPVDPYDLQGERGLYPDPNFKNGKPCGPNALFEECFKPGAVVAVPKDPIRPVSVSIKEKSDKPVSSAEKPVEKGWTRFRSDHIPYQIDIPFTWKGQSMEAYDYFDDDSNQTSTQLSVYPIRSTGVGDIEAYTAAYASDIKRLGGKVFYSGNMDKNLIPLLNLNIASQKTAYVVFIPGDYPNRTYIRAAFMAYGKMIGIQIATENSTLSAKAPLLEKILLTFTLLPENTIKTKSTEAPKPAVEKKISISKKPEDLFRLLLITQIRQDELPSGMSSGGISAGEIDATGKALKQIGAVTIKIEDSISTPARGTPNGGVVYAIFPDSSGAKSASEVIGTHLGNGQVLKDFPYPTKIYTIENFFGVITRVLITSAENVTVVATFTGTDSNLIQSRTIDLGHAAIEHLGKVGK